MAETTKNYISNYSGDQLDAAIAVLGSLETMFLSKGDFEKFKKNFDDQMALLDWSVKTVLEFASKSLISYEEIN